MHKSALAGLVTSALAIAGLLWSAMSAHAQGSASGQKPTSDAGAAKGEVVMEEITVTGIRLSLAKSVGVKRNADIVSDAIVAEDIGKFPQQNMAESLQRITGVQITRSKGEGQLVSVRGLDRNSRNCCTTADICLRQAAHEVSTSPFFPPTLSASCK